MEIEAANGRRFPAGQKERLLLSFFQSLQQKSSSSSVWSVEHSLDSPIIGKWKFGDDWKLSLPVIELSRHPRPLAALLLSLQLVIQHMRENIIGFIQFLSEFFATIIAQFYPVLELSKEGRLEELKDGEECNEIEFVGVVRLRQVNTSTLLI